MSKIRDYKLNPPKSKTELNKESMLKYVSSMPKEDKEWFVNLMASNKENKRNNLTHEEIEGYNMTAIREAFAQKYFKDISSKAKKTAKIKKKKESFEDQLAALLK